MRVAVGVDQGIERGVEARGRRHDGNGHFGLDARMIKTRKVVYIDGQPQHSKHDHHQRHAADCPNLLPSRLTPPIALAQDFFGSRPRFAV